MGYLGRRLAGVVHFEEAPQGPSSSARGVGEGGHNSLPLEVEKQCKKAGSYIVVGEPWVLRGGAIMCRRGEIYVLAPSWKL